MERVHFILYVRDQAESRAFWSRALDVAPSLDVPGMTELELPGGAVLGLMPEQGIRRLLGDAVAPPRSGARAEIYVVVDDPAAAHARAIAAGARELSALAPRDWGHDAAYSVDPDGHVLAFARVTRGPSSPGARARPSS